MGYLQTFRFTIHYVIILTIFSKLLMQVNINETGKKCILLISGFYLLQEGTNRTLNSFKTMKSECSTTISYICMSGLEKIVKKMEHGELLRKLSSNWRLFATCDWDIRYHRSYKNNNSFGNAQGHCGEWFSNDNWFYS